MIVSDSQTESKITVKVLRQDKKTKLAYAMRLKLQHNIVIQHLQRKPKTLPYVIKLIPHLATKETSASV